MPDAQVEINTLLQVMANQRNAAMDDVVRLTAQLASLQPKGAEPPAPEPVGEPG